MSCEVNQEILKECSSCKNKQPLCNYTTTKNRKGETVLIARCKTCIKKVNQATRQKPEFKSRKNFLRRQKWKIPEEKQKILQRLEETRDARLARRRERDRNMPPEKKEAILADKRRRNAALRAKEGYKESYNRYRRGWEKKQMQENPKHRIDHLMSKGIRRSMSDNGVSKSGRSWESLVGYTIEDVVVYFQTLFDDQIGWHNMKEWEIDHVIPKAAFVYESCEDPQFKECWALSNLRPLMRKENRAKNDKINGVSVRKLRREGKLPFPKGNKKDGNQTVCGLQADQTSGPVSSGAQGQADSTELLQGMRSTEVQEG